MSKLSISNIGWSEDLDRSVYELMRSHSISGLEIAPTRIFPDAPYDDPAKASKWAREIRAEYGFSIPSMQSIWYGRTERLFGSDEERSFLIEYTKKAIEFAEAIECRNLVFGCPRNRKLTSEKDESTAIEFFRTLGDYAADHGTVIGMEANPPVYNTDFINDTASALDLIEKVGSRGFRLNLDIGAMIINNEDVSVLKNREHLINHIHLSEPELKAIVPRDIHREVASLIKSSDYPGYVSIEACRQDDIRDIEKMIVYEEKTFK